MFGCKWENIDAFELISTRERKKYPVKCVKEEIFTAGLLY